jgi:hypothetical protein
MPSALIANKSSNDLDASWHCCRLLAAVQSRLKENTSKFFEILEMPYIVYS